MASNSTSTASESPRSAERAKCSAASARCPDRQQRARSLPVQNPPAGPAGGLVDDVANERVMQLIAELAAALLLDHHAGRGRARRESARAPPTSFPSAPSVAERHRPPHHRQQLQNPSRRGIEPAKLRRSPARSGPREGAADAEPQDRPCSSMSARSNPIANKGLPCERSQIQSTSARGGARSITACASSVTPARASGGDLQTRQQPVLVELEQDVRGDLVPPPAQRAARQRAPTASIVEVPAK